MRRARSADRTPAEIKPLAILAPDLEIAARLAAELDLAAREWIYVSSVARVLGVEPGRYALRIPVGRELTRDADTALDYMIGRGWRPETVDTPPSSRSAGG